MVNFFSQESHLPMGMIDPVFYANLLKQFSHDSFDIFTFQVRVLASQFLPDNIAYNVLIANDLRPISR